MKYFPGARCFFVFFFLIAGVPAFLRSQEIVTAERYLERVSERYAGISDYEAGLAIRSGNQDMRGQVSFLNPSFLRIDFSEPSEQVICFNGELLTVYLPGARAVLNQEITSHRSTGATGASMASSQGLSMLRRNYVPSFVSGPDPIPLDEGSPERVVKLRLARRLLSEGFREIILSIDPISLLIRRIEGRTIADTLVSFDFSNIRTNLGIPEGRFIYDSPASANVYNNFLFRDTE
ncbi:MAG: outer membrane lipoprotein carrier protein LolA [Treponema sp.]|jgi:outer membrane lipoprotein-sorting protein|nr:outer membrane lipoprotein carrier protein LolA [Treponema sp.]